MQNPKLPEFNTHFKEFTSKNLQPCLKGLFFLSFSLLQNESSSFPFRSNIIILVFKNQGIDEGTSNEKEKGEKIKKIESIEKAIKRKRKEKQQQERERRRK